MLFVALLTDLFTRVDNYSYLWITCLLQALLCVIFAAVNYSMPVGRVSPDRPEVDCSPLYIIQAIICIGFLASYKYKQMFSDKAVMSRIMIAVSVCV